MHPEKAKSLLLVALALLLLPFEAPLAGLVVLPDSHHQQFQTYGLYFEEQSSLLYKSASRAWGAIGETAALLEEPDWAWRPQLVAHASANASFRLSPARQMLLTETVDARVGLAVDLAFSDEFRGMVMWTHQSGHISDDVDDPSLIGSNLGNEILTLRVVRDFDRTARVGGGLRPVLGSDPGMMRFGAEQFGELFPWGKSPDPRHFSPFIAAGLEEYGRNSVDLTFHAQLGFAAGSHFGPAKHPALRAVLGWYDGVDPRLKYFQFRNARSDFLYSGVMLDL